MSPQEVGERVEPFVRTLRAARPSTPIVLVEDRNYTDGFLVTSKRERNEASHRALRAVFDRLIADGVTGMYYLPGKDLLGDDGEATVDSSHPTDLGFVRQAAAFQSELAKTLEQSLTDRLATGNMRGENQSVPRRARLGPARLFNAPTFMALHRR